MDQKEKILDLLTEFKKTLDATDFDGFDLTIKVILKKEEAVYKAAGHPDFTNHKKIHDEFIRTLTSFKYQYFLIGEKLPDNYFFLSTSYFGFWINSHDLEDDLQMESYLRIEDFIKNGR